MVLAERKNPNIHVKATGRGWSATINAFMRVLSLTRTSTLTLLTVFVVFAALTTSGCKSSSENGENNTNNEYGCPEGHRVEGPACVPVFDGPEDCRGPKEMEALGGGCRPVGVLQCAQGFASGEDGGCEPILPDHECPPGTMEVIGETECRPVGVIQCAEGFVSDGEGGCNAILPPGPDPCPPGSIERIGYDTCQPLGDCGPDPEQGGSPWGNIQADDKTFFVDAASNALEPDGSQDAPFKTVGAALAEVENGGQVAIAAGDYEERLILSKPVRLIGRCSEKVTLRGVMRFGVAEPALRIGAGGSGSEVRSVTLTGPGDGLFLDGVVDVIVEEVEVQSTGYYGVLAMGGADAVIRRVKVTGCDTVGILSADGVMYVEESVVQNTVSEVGTGNFGRGISVQCTHLETCGSLYVMRSLIAGNRDAGISVFGVDATVISSVVRDTLSMESTLSNGSGINAECHPEMGECGSLHVEESLIAGNRAVGISVFGVDATVVSTVVRDTLPQDTDRTGGIGISAQCHHEFGVCGNLLLESSLVAQNRDVGVFAAGVDTTVVSSVVRDTRPQESNLEFGRGISAQCYPYGEVCGTLHVEGSLVAGNRDVGIFAADVDATVVSTVVRDTLPQDSNLDGGMGIQARCHSDSEKCGSLHVAESLLSGNRDASIGIVGVHAKLFSSVVRDTVPRESDGKGGWGINAHCHSDLGVCGSLLVESSLVADNMDVGIFAWGVDMMLISTIVRDTLSLDSDETGGKGINAGCYWDLGVCGNLLVESSLVVGNRETGIFSAGFDTAVVSSVVRDTLSRESDGKIGRGINSQCYPNLGVCGSLWVEDSLVAGNREKGIFSAGVDTTVVSSVVQDTHGRDSDLTGGVGIGAICCPDLGVCRSFRVEESLVDGNKALGMLFAGVHATIISSVVRDTLSQESDGSFGRGINAQCDESLEVCGSLMMENSMVVGSEDTGIFIAGAAANLQRVAVINTQTNTGGPWEGEFGQGIWALCDLRIIGAACSTLSMNSCLVRSSRSAGVAVEGVSGFMADSLVDTVLAQPRDNLYGYGIQISARSGGSMPTFHVRGSEIRDARLAGVFYYRSAGNLSGSVISGGEYSVVMNENSSPTISKDNELTGSVSDEPTWVNMYPSPAPTPAEPGL